MIAIVDYGLGNVFAFANAYKRLNIGALVVRSADELLGASKIILPGVGAFDQAMQLLDQSGMRKPLIEAVLDRRVPLLGVCVGMQILANSSDEGRLPGLGFLPGKVRGFESHRGFELPVPHMGWNDVEALQVGLDVFAGMTEAPRFYFLHSYYFESDEQADVAAVSTYGFRFAAAVRRGNVIGVQFHPEKSHGFGMQLLRNFAAL